MLKAVDQRGVPLAVVNARMSERSFRALARRAAARPRSLMRRIALSLPQALADAERLRALGTGSVVVCGNLKFDVPPPPRGCGGIGEGERRDRRSHVLLAASTHPGEERAVIAAQPSGAAGRASPDDRGAAPSLSAGRPSRGYPCRGLRSRRRSQGDADRRGNRDLSGRHHRRNGIVVRRGGHRLSGRFSRGAWRAKSDRAGEAARPGAARAACEQFPRRLCGPCRREGGGPGRGRAALPAPVKRLIDDPDERRRLSREAFACVERFTGALDRTLDALEPYLAPLARSRDAAPRA